MLLSAIFLLRMLWILFIGVGISMNKKTIAFFLRGVRGLKSFISVAYSEYECVLAAQQ